MSEQRCNHRSLGCFCALTAHEGYDDHECICERKWISAHAYVRSPHSGAGNCRCGRPEGSSIHRVARQAKGRRRR
jgi:hypothetical protein